MLIFICEYNHHAIYFSQASFQATLYEIKCKMLDNEEVSQLKLKSFRKLCFSRVRLYFCHEKTFRIILKSAAFEINKAFICQNRGKAPSNIRKDILFIVIYCGR